MTQAVFIHLPKTAGTSFHSALCLGFGAHAVSPPFAATQMTPEQAEDLRQYEIVSGHISMPDARLYFPQAKLFTILRDPVDRCVSWYYFARTVGESQHADVAAAQAHTLDEFFQLDQSITYRNIFNRQVRQLGAHVLEPDADMKLALSQAQEALKKCVWVGRYEHLQQDFIRLGTVFPEMAKITLPHLNATGERKPIAQIDAALKLKIEHYNSYDIELYNEACRDLGQTKICQVKIEPDKL